MALVTHLVLIVFVASVQCSYRQWHSKSWNDQNQNANSDRDSTDFNNQPWIISQASVQNVPMWRDLALSTGQMKQKISNRWPHTQSNTNSQRDWYKPNQQTSQEIKEDMSNKPILQPNVIMNLWHKAPVSDILLAEWTDVNPNANGKQEMKKSLSSNPWNQLQMSANQMQGEPNKYSSMNQQPQAAVNNKPVDGISSTENIWHQVPLFQNDITTWYTEAKPTMAEVNTNMNIQWNMNSKPIYDQNPTMYSWIQTPATVNEPTKPQFTDNGNINNINSEIFTSYPVQYNSNKPVSNNELSKWYNEMKPAPNMQREMNAYQKYKMNKNIKSEWNQSPTYHFANGWSEMPLAENNNNWQIKTKPADQFHSNINVWGETSNEENGHVVNQNINSKPNFQTNSHVNTWKPVRSSKSMNMPQQISEQNGYIIMKPEQINKPQLQAGLRMNEWNQADKGNDFSGWFSNQISASGKNHPELQSTTSQLQSDTKAWSQISGGIASSTWNNNGNSVQEAGPNTNINTMPWNQVEAGNKPSGWSTNDNLSEKNKPDQLSNNVYGFNQIAEGNGPSAWFINGNLPEKNEPDQNFQLDLEFNTNVNKWNQEVAENIAAGWYNNGNTKNELQSNNNVNGWNQEAMSGKNKNMQSNINQVVSGKKPSDWYKNNNSLLAETYPDMYRKVTSPTTSNVNNWYNFNSEFSTNLGQATINKSQMQNSIHSDKSFTNIVPMQKPSPYLTVPQPYNTLEPLEVAVSMKAPNKVPFYKNNNVGNGPNTTPNTIIVLPKDW